MKNQAPKSSRDQSLTRREAIRFLGMATAATGFAMSSLPADAAAPEANLFDDSVFKDTCRDGNGTKYENYDNPLAYPIVAFWLMLTTDEWRGCIAAQSGTRTEDAAKQWRIKLANELGLAPTYAEYLYTQSQSGSNVAAFTAVKQLWVSFITDPPELPDEEKHLTFDYGTRPCMGGKSLLQIANLNRGERLERIKKAKKPKTGTKRQ